MIWSWLPPAVIETQEGRMAFIAFQLFGVSPTLSTLHVKNGSGRELDGISGQLLIWFGSLIAS